MQNSIKALGEIVVSVGAVCAMFHPEVPVWIKAIIAVGCTIRLFSYIF